MFELAGILMLCVGTSKSRSEHDEFNRFVDSVTYHYFCTAELLVTKADIHT